MRRSARQSVACTTSDVSPQIEIIKRDTQQKKKSESKHIRGETTEANGVGGDEKSPAKADDPTNVSATTDVTASEKEVQTRINDQLEMFFYHFGRLHENDEVKLYEEDEEGSAARKYDRSTGIGLTFG